MGIRALIATFGAAAVAGMINTGAVAADPTVIKIGSFTPPRAKHRGSS